MSRNFSWFLRGIIYIPFCFVLFICFHGYVNYKFTQSLELCYSKAAMIDESSEMRDFIGCLQENNNSVVRWYMKPERYYNAIQPHVPCQWVGRWQAKRDKISFAIELKANGKFKIDNGTMEVLSKQKHNDYTEGYEGVWSSPNKETIMWFGGSRIWPIDENKVDWLNKDQLVIYELNGEKTYYQRQSAHIENCPYYP
ncbi:hypothetical protein FK216_10990 [Moraxellaceae bacterium AER2_44_116]|nr:hypothetical protein [Moraxellaceae bacterium]TQC96775.1 hypothetical protein FK216_10990 [Moraxellaceae bacterium AER2_44_116]